MQRNFLSAAIALALGACSSVGVRTGTEEPHFNRVAKVGGLEIRHYESRVVAETVVSGNPDAARDEGFGRLAGYIFGANGSSAAYPMTAAWAHGSTQTLAMTAPVAQSRDANGAWRIQFFMPHKYRLRDLPQPHNPKVTLVALPPQTFAVMRFSGARDGDAVMAKQAALMASLPVDHWRAMDRPVAWFYDPPWTLPMMRRNEVAVLVEARP